MNGAGVGALRRSKGGNVRNRGHADKPDCYRIYRIWEHQASDGLLIIALASDRRAGRRRRESAGRRDLLPGGPE